MSTFIVIPEGAYPFLRLNDRQFLQQCRCDTYMASGHGGQKRNRTYSAVRLTHLETGLSVIAEESRSQGENRIKALKRLRMALALYIRKAPSAESFTMPEEIRSFFREDCPLQINKKNSQYPLFCATVLDVVYMEGGRIGDASRVLNTSTGRLNKFLSRDKDLFISVNELRAHFKLKPLHSV